jgi:hypothetical protein
MKAAGALAPVPPRTIMLVPVYVGLFANVLCRGVAAAVRRLGSRRERRRRRCGRDVPEIPSA